MSPPEGQSGHQTVKFEIEGRGEIVTSFVKRNEEIFFEFVNDFERKISNGTVMRKKRRKTRRNPVNKSKIMRLNTIRSIKMFEKKGNSRGVKPVKEAKEHNENQLSVIESN
mmetsp:Transcript_12848/g.12839  ORF Transcript_12848/g.12839 Transcript_12848/m.12839 type:complete len:111 (+) Transcript_12848:86-418(+)